MFVWLEEVNAMQRHWGLKGLGTTSSTTQCFLSCGFSVLMQKGVKPQDKRSSFLERSCEDFSPKSTQMRTSTQSQEYCHSFLLLLRLSHGSSPWRTQRQCSFIWHLKDVVAVSRLGQAFSILRRMALEVTNDQFWDTSGSSHYPQGDQVDLAKSFLYISETTQE